MIENYNFSKKANRYLKNVCMCLFFMQGMFAVANNTPATAYPLYQDQTISRTSTSNMENDYYKIAKDFNITSFNLNYSVGVAIPVLEKREGSYSGTLISSVGIANGNTDFNLDYSGGNYFYLLRVYEDGIGGYTYAITGFNPTSCPTPTVLSGVNASSTNNSVTLSGLSGSNATNHLVVISDTNSFTAYGVEENAPVSVGTVYGGSGEQIVYAGAAAGAGVTITNLSPSTTYYIRVYGYDVCTGFYVYNGGNTLPETTCVIDPTTATAMSLAPSGLGSILINSISGVNFSHGEENGYIVKASSTTNSFSVPTNGASLPTATTAFLADDQVVYVGTSDTPAITVSNLTENTEYFFKVYSYSLCDGTYYIENTGFETSTTTCGFPSDNTITYFQHHANDTNSAEIVSFHNTTTTDGLLVYINDSNSFTHSSTMTTLPTVDTSWNEAGQQLIGNATLSGVNYFPTNLNLNTQYYVRAYTYQLCDGVYRVNTTTTGNVNFTTCNFSESLASAPVFGVLTDTSMELSSFSHLTPTAPEVLPTGYIVKMNTVNSFTPNVNKTALPTANTVYGGGEQVIYAGTSINPNITITGLSANTEYFFTIYAYFDGCTGILYQQTGYEFSKSNDTSLIDPTITFTDIVKNSGDPDFNLAVTSNSAGTISYTILSQTGSGSSLSGTNNETVTLGTAGTVSIEASQVANGIYNSGSKTITLTINKIAPTITFDEFLDIASIQTYDLTNYTSSNSSGAFSYEIIGDALGYSLSGANNASLNSIATAGSFIVRVTQAESDSYLAGQKEAIYAFINDGLNPKTDIAIANFEDFSTDPLVVTNLAAFTSTYANPITYSIEGANPTGSIVVGSAFTAGTPGTLTVRATTSASSPLFNQTIKDITVTILGTPQTITFNALADVNEGGPNFNLTATASSGLTVTYVSLDTNVATVSGNTVTIVGQGTTNITASQDGNATYGAAPDVVQPLTVNPLVITDQTVSVSPTSGLCSVDAVVSLDSSQSGADYYLRDDADNNIIEGPISGTGSGFSFGTDAITANKTYNTYAVVSGKEMNAFQFDGVDGYLSVPNLSPQITGNAITVEARVYIPSSDDADQLTSLITQEYNGVGDGAKIKYQLSIANGLLIAGFHSPGWTWTSGIAYPKDQWIHVASTYDQNTIRVYINGVEVQSLASTAVLPTGNTLGWRIGRRWDFTQTSPHIFGGVMTDMRVWNTTRSAAEILANKNVTIASATDLIASYTFNDGTGMTVKDYSGNNLDATLVDLVGDTTNWIPNNGLEMSNTPAVTVTPIADQVVSLVQPDTQSATISIDNSQVGVNYTLRDHADNSVIEGPIAGTGSGIVFATEAITADKTYNVYAEVSTCNLQLTNTPIAIFDKVVVSPIVYLQGATLNPNTGEETLMRDDLRVAGVIPTTSPYADALVCNASVFIPTGANAIVDWVFVELRDETTNTTIIASKSALLQRDGDVVATDGTSPLNFARAGGNYYVVIKHRGHLGIMSSSAFTLSSTTTSVDFTDSTSQITYGSNAQTSFGMFSGKVGMWAGNVGGDISVRYLGSGNDTNSLKDTVLADVGNTTSSNLYSFIGYSVGDVNLDGTVRYQGSGNDTNTIKDIMLAHPDNQGSPSNLFIIQEQLPEN
ncbi:MAG: hypothetical protein COA88_03145 [Kordia sp.]|nr:MAG: hypothetical protein COA88_03145 [Kordia sp.]